MFKSIAGHPITELLLNLVVLISLIAGAKLVLNLLPDGGLIGDLKKFWMLA